MAKRKKQNKAQEHRALGDALATAALIRRLAELDEAAARWSNEVVEEV